MVKRYRDITFKVMLTSDENDLIMNAIEKSGYSKREYLLHTIDKTVIISKNDIKGLEFDIRKLGINLNQIARVMNASGVVDTRLSDNLNVLEKDVNTLCRLLNLLTSTVNPTEASNR